MSTRRPCCVCESGYHLSPGQHNAGEAEYVWLYSEVVSDTVSLSQHPQHASVRYCSGHSIRSTSLCADGSSGPQVNHTADGVWIQRSITAAVWCWRTQHRNSSNTEINLYEARLARRSNCSGWCAGDVRQWSDHEVFAASDCSSVVKASLSGIHTSDRIPRGRTERRRLRIIRKHEQVLTETDTIV